MRSDDERLKMSLEDILQFVMGTTRIPPLGFDKKPEIEFHNDTLLSPNTCLLKLHLAFADSS